MQHLVNTCSIIFNTVCIENYHARYSFVRFLSAYWYYLRILVASTENIQGCEQKYRRERHICSTGDRTNYLLRQVLATYVKDLRTLFIVCTVFLPKLFMPLLLYHSSLFYVVVFAMFFIRLNISVSRYKMVQQFYGPSIRIMLCAGYPNKKLCRIQGFTNFSILT